MIKRSSNLLFYKKISNSSTTFWFCLSRMLHEARHDAEPTARVDFTTLTPRSIFRLAIALDFANLDTAGSQQDNNAPA